MQSWWRVLRGVWPYRTLVVISIVCALGVGLSYASGVAVMLPVLKVFISSEGIHGWADRTAAQSRLGVSIWDLDQNTQRGKSGVVVEGTNASKLASAALNTQGQAFKMITSVSYPEALPKATTISSPQWTRMVNLLARAPANSHLLLTVEGENAKNPSAVIELEMPKLAFHDRMLLRLSDLLSGDRFMALVELVVFFIVLCIVGSTFRYYQQYLGMAVATRVIADLRRRMYDRITQLPTSYFAQKGTSDLMSRLTQDTNTLTDGVSMAFGKAIQEPVKAAGAFGVAVVLDWRLTAMIVVSSPILAVIIRKFSKRMRKAGRRALENWSSMLGIINETLIGARVVKAYSAEGYERRRFARVNKALVNEQTRLAHYGSMSRPTIETLSIIVTSIPMLIAAHWVLQTPPLISRENFFTVLVCLAAMLEPLRKLSDVNARVQQSNVAATRVFEVIDQDVEPNHDHSLPKLPRHSQSVEFRDIVFSYPGHDEVVLKNVSCKVLHGQTVAVVGGNGSGKSTLLNLLPRLYWPTSGQVLIDGTDISTVSLRSLRKQIGLVTQDTLLFADTIYNNIAYGTRHATKEQVLDAARRAYADDFIKNLDEGYETRVGEHGVRLSGGQKQRIAIARAILHDPSILILDEAMSQIDSDSEMKISQALREFTKDRTVLMIAHRFQTVINADSIIVLDHGRVAGIGTHTQLLDNCPAYRKLYENQFREMDTFDGEAESGAESPVTELT